MGMLPAEAWRVDDVAVEPGQGEGTVGDGGGGSRLGVDPLHEVAGQFAVAWVHLLPSIPQLLAGQLVFRQLSHEVRNRLQDLRKVDGISVEHHGPYPRREGLHLLLRRKLLPDSGEATRLRGHSEMAPTELTESLRV
jgi:hypothetical protein